MKNKFLKSFLMVLLSALSAYAQLTPAERQAQEASPEVKKIIAESSILDRYVTKEQWKQIVKEVSTTPGSEKVIVVDTRDQQNCFGVFNQLRAEGWAAEESMCEQDLSKPHVAISVGAKLAKCIIDTSPNMGMSKDKCPYITIKIRW